MLTAVCATSTTMVGSANFNNVGRIGPLNSVARVASLRGCGCASRGGAVTDPAFSDGACASRPASGRVASSSAIFCVLSQSVCWRLFYCMIIVMHYYDRTAISGWVTIAPSRYGGWLRRPERCDGRA